MSKQRSAPERWSVPIAGHPSALNPRPGIEELLPELSRPPLEDQRSASRFAARLGVPGEEIVDAVDIVVGYLPVDHDGNQSASPEEADMVLALVRTLTGEGATWIDRNGDERPLRIEDMLIIAPYNA